MDNTVQFKVKSVKRQTLNQRVYQNIKQSILDGELPPGCKLSEVQMGKQLGVSATPVREAFRMLSMEGLIRVDPWKGAVVQGYNQQLALETLQCREALESLALKLFMEKAGKKDIQALEYMINQAENTDDINEFVSLSSAIHDIWLEGCQNSKLLTLMSLLNTELLRERNFSANNQIRKNAIIAEHREILKAIRSGDISAAVSALSKHIQNGYQYSADSQ